MWFLCLIALVIAIAAIWCFGYTFTSCKGYSNEAKQQHNYDTNISLILFYILFPIAYWIITAIGES